MPLKKGTWVKLKEHETFGIIVEQRKGDAELPEPERSYKIHVEEQTLYYPPSRFEVVEESTPERVSLRERHEHFRKSPRSSCFSWSALRPELIKALADPDGTGLYEEADMSPINPNICIFGTHHAYQYKTKRRGYFQN